jgi:hypothetical protein
MRIFKRSAEKIKHYQVLLSIFFVLDFNENELAILLRPWVNKLDASFKIFSSKSLYWKNLWHIKQAQLWLILTLIIFYIYLRASSMPRIHLPTIFQFLSGFPKISSSFFLLNPILPLSWEKTYGFQSIKQSR